jgi:sugar phosphate isomerase/epimerase
MSEKSCAPDRRKFLCTTASIVAAVAGTAPAVSSQANPRSDADSQPQRPAHDPSAATIYKSAKWDMIQIDGSVADKFRMQKELGYDGMELISPSNLDPAEVRRASEETGMPVHGVVDMKHWENRLSSPDPAQRELGLSYLQQSLRDAKAFGGDAVLLVPGRVAGKDETHDDVWNRSIPEIRKALPLASQLGVRVLIETVWNGFCETPQQMCDYIDAIDSPWVGSYCDFGNCRKFGPSQDWIHALGHRIVKLDCKDWSKARGFCKIGDGDVDWPAVRQALAGIGYSGWCTAEVPGGGRDELADISLRMNRMLRS